MKRVFTWVLGAVSFLLSLVYYNGFYDGDKHSSKNFGHASYKNIISSRYHLLKTTNRKNNDVADDGADDDHITLEKYDADFVAENNDKAKPVWCLDEEIRSNVQYCSSSSVNATTQMKDLPYHDRQTLFQMLDQKMKKGFEKVNVNRICLHVLCDLVR